jgi:alanine racemase
MKPTNCVTLEVSLGALAANYRLLQNRHAKKHIAAVVKANAYGLGVEAVSRVFWQEGCREFFVATLEEGIELREHLAQASIGVFQGVFPGEEKDFQHYGLTPVLNTPEQIERWQKVASLASAILHVDTGMTRLGLTHTELGKLAAKNANLNFAWVMSHLACANDPSDPKNQEQIDRFKMALKLLPGCKTSFANSSGLFLPEEFHFDMGRPGCALYGITPVETENPMRHVATLSAPILQIRTLDRDETVGYGSSYKAAKGARIAIVMLGYADGVLRALSNKGFAFIGGQKVPFAGRVSMDMVALDVSAIPENKLSLVGRADFINEKQTVNDVAALASTIGYEIFTRIGSRVRRIYQ